MHKDQVSVQNKTKKALKSIGRIFLLALPTLLLAKPTFAWIPLAVLGGGLLLAPLIVETLIRGLIAIIGGILHLISWLAVMVTENVALAGGKSLINSTEVREIWELMLGGVNVLFFLALAIFAVMIITGAQNYNLKKALSGLVYAIAIANLSYDIVKIFVLLGDTLARGIGQSFGALVGAGDKDIVRELLTVRWEFLIRQPHILNSQEAWQDIGQAIMAATVYLVTLAITTYTVVKLAVVLIERAIRLTLSIVLAPLLFALQVFPGDMAKLGKDWWSDLIKWNLVLPYAYLLLGMAAVLMPDAKELNISDTLISAIKPQGEATDTNVWGTIMLIIASIAVMLGAANTPATLKLNNFSGNLTKPVDGLLKSTGKFASGMAVGAMRSANISARKRAAAGQFFGNNKVLGIDVGDKVGGFLNAGAKKLYGVQDSVATKVGQAQRFAKDGLEAPSKYSEDLLKNADSLNFLKQDDFLQTQAAKSINKTPAEFRKMDDKERNEATQAYLKKNKAFDKTYTAAKKRYEKSLTNSVNEANEKEPTAKGLLKDYRDNLEAIAKHDSGEKRLSLQDLAKKQMEANVAQKLLHRKAQDNSPEGREARIGLNNIHDEDFKSNGIAVASGRELAARAGLKYVPRYNIKAQPGHVEGEKLQERAALRLQVEKARNDVATAEATITDKSTVQLIEAANENALKSIINPTSADQLAAQDNFKELARLLANPTTDKEVREDLRNGNTSRAINREIAEIEAEEGPGHTSTKEARIKSVLDKYLQKISNKGLKDDFVNAAASAMSRASGMKANDLLAGSELHQKVNSPTAQIPEIQSLANAVLAQQDAKSNLRSVEEEIDKQFGAAPEIKARVEKAKATIPNYEGNSELTNRALEILAQEVTDSRELETKSLLDLADGIRTKNPKTTKLTQGHMDAIKKFLEDSFDKVPGVREYFAPDSHTTESAVKSMTAHNAVKLIFQSTYQKPKKP